MSEEKKNFKERLTAMIDIAKLKAGEVKASSTRILSELKMPEKLRRVITKTSDDSAESKSTQTETYTKTHALSKVALARLATTALEWLTIRVKNRNARFYGRALTLLLCMYFVADIMAILVDSQIPTPKSSDSRTSRLRDSSMTLPTLADYEVIFSRNLFNSPEEVTKPTNPMNAEPVPTTLQLNLVGTLILRDELRSIATIEDKAAQAVYPVRAQDEIPGKAKIISVGARRVVFFNTSNNQKEYIELPVDNTQIPNVTVSRSKRANLNPGIEQVSENQFNISRSEVDKAMGDMNQILTQARCVPNFESGLPAGFKCFQIVKGSIYDQLGLKDNDVVCGINGQPMNDITKAFEQLKELQTSNHIELCVKRNGRQQNFAYDVR